MKRLRLVVEYDGTDFSGWQFQENGPTVQAAIEDAIFRLTGERQRVTAAGRTDAGVHALGQVASFALEKDLSPLRLLRGLNAFLPPSVAIVSVVDAPLDFDPRRHALGKLYRYAIWNAQSRTPIHARFSWHVYPALDLAKMRVAAAPLVGEHDFSAFRAADCDRKHTVRTLKRLDVAKDGAHLTVEAEGDGFLKNMVRILVGTLVDAGRGKLDAAAIPSILAGRDRTRAGRTAPAQGLTLVRVDYER